MDQDEEKYVHTAESKEPLSAYLDAKFRSLDALEQYPDFFTEEHLDRVQQVVEICDKFFKVKNGIYVNHRTGRNNPFSVVKVNSPYFPAVSLARKATEYRDPVLALGGEIRHSPQGVIIRIT